MVDRFEYKSKGHVQAMLNKFKCTRDDSWAMFRPW